MRAERDQRQPALPPAQRADPRTPAARTSRIAIAGRRAAHHHRRTRSLPEAACTSTQLHVQTSPDAVRAPTGTPPRRSPACSSALGANSPYLLGKELWRETRIPLFEQATDTRSEELKAQGVRPRVWFGERWITSVFDLFEENVRYFPALLPISDDEDPLEVLDARRHPGARRAAAAQRHDLPLEPAGLRRRRTASRTCGWRTGCCPPGRPSSTSMANAAFYFGLVRALAEHERPLWSQMSFSAAEENFHTAARDGHRRRSSTGRASARCRPPSWCCAGCCRWPTTGLDALGRRRRPSATGCSASSSSAA